MNDIPMDKQSPAAIRDAAFTRRMRGLDAEEVYEYLDLLADQMEAAEMSHRETRTENERLKAELQSARQDLEQFESAESRVNDQVVQLLSQAQLVAEEMVEDVNRDARERLGHARAHEQQILQEAVGVAGDEVRSYAREAQSQMQSIMESFAAQVERLGDPSSVSTNNGRGSA